jgi:hypothetical protein
MTKHLQKRQDWIRGRREKRKLARMARARRQILRYTLLFVLAGAAVCAFTHVPWSIRNLQEDVVIHGNTVVSDLQVRKAVSTALDQPLYSVDPRKLQSTLCALPAVRHAFVRRYVFPRPMLRVELMEEFPWATYSPSPEAAPTGVISQTGRFIPLAVFPKVVQPALRLSGDKALKLSAADIAQWDSWVRLIEAQTGQPVVVVDMSKPTAVQAYSGGFELHLGAVDSTLQRRIGRLSSVMPTVATLKEPLKYIDLSLDSNVPLKVDKNRKHGADETRGARFIPTSATIPTGATIPTSAADASLLPTDHSAPLSTAPSVAATSAPPSF